MQLDIRKLFETQDMPDLIDLLPRIVKIKGKVPIRPLDDNKDSNSVDQDSLNQDSFNQVANKSYSELSPKYWLNILPNSASPKHLLKFWLSHLYWQVARHTTSEQVALNDGVSIWRFNKSSTQVDHYKNVTAFELPPIVYETAAIELIKWAIFAKLAGLVPMTLLPDYALTYLAKVEKERESDSIYWPRRSDFSAWLAPGYHSDTIYDTCVQHAVWQYVLRDQKPFDALIDSLSTLSHPLYQPLFDSLHRLNS